MCTRLRWRNRAARDLTGRIGLGVSVVAVAVAILVLQVRRVPRPAGLHRGAVKVLDDLGAPR
jgi:hypothetical protein